MLSAMRALARFWPLLLLVIAGVAIWTSGLAGQISWPMLARHQAALTEWVASHPVLAPVIYMAVYAAAVAVCLPESAVLTVAGGLLFGTALGGALAIVGSTTGAVILFLAARYHLADAMAARAGGFFEKVRQQLQRNGFSYLLAIRIIPLFPFWLVNLAAALCGMRLLPYMAATLIGIIPGTLIFASIGAGIGSVLAAGGKPNLAIILSPRLLVPLMALACLSLLPVLLRSWKRRDA